MYEYEASLEALLDHPSVFQKIAPLLDEHFIVHSTWNTLVPAKSEGGGFHQDASGPSLFVSAHVTCAAACGLLYTQCVDRLLVIPAAAEQPSTARAGPRRVRPDRSLTT